MPHSIMDIEPVSYWVCLHFLSMCYFYYGFFKLVCKVSLAITVVENQLKQTDFVEHLVQ